MSALLTVDDKLQAAPDVAVCQRREAEARAPRLQRWDDLVDIVADEAETRISRVLLDHCAHQ